MPLGRPGAVYLEKDMEPRPRRSARPGRSAARAGHAGRSTAPPPLTIRAGTVRDTRTIYAMLKGLAGYERLLGRFRSSVERVRRDGFGPRRYFRTLICWLGPRPVGVAVYFFTYSTFEARPTLYVEDVFVWPRDRGRGAGGALLAELARIAVRKGCARMEWTVLDWNAPAIRFYERLGTIMRREWVLARLTGAPLRRLAQVRSGAKRRNG